MSRRAPSLGLPFALAACSPSFVPDGDVPEASSDDTHATAAVCTLASDLAVPWFLEGDTVAFALRCAEPGVDAVFAASDIPEGARFDPATAAFVWPTGPADGGRVDAIFTVDAGDGAVPSAQAVTFWVADDPSNPDNVPVEAATYTEEWALPVVHVSVSGSIGESYVPATVTFRGVTLDALIKVRGASSAYYTKPGYLLEFNAEEIEIDEWGASRDHLVLLSTFDDNSYVRQKLVYDLWTDIAAWWDERRLTPRSFFTVVYVQGAYHGLFVGLDRIDDEFADHMGFERGADIYKAVSHDANFYLTSAYGGYKSNLHQGYEKAEGEDETDFADLDSLVEFTGGSSDADLVASAETWLDPDEFSDWFLLVWYSLSEDSAGKNSYLYDDPTDGRFRYAPWDFNHSWGQGWYTYRTSAASVNGFQGTNKVFRALQSERATELWARYAEMEDGGPFDAAVLKAKVDGYYALIEPSAARDWENWGYEYRTYGGWASEREAAGDWTDYPGEKEYLYAWMEERAEVMRDAAGR